MFTLKVVALGLVLCFAGTIAYLWLMVGNSKAMELTALRTMTVGEPLYWLGVVAMFGLSFAFVRFTR
jgi:hypothetical protein